MRATSPCSVVSQRPELWSDVPAMAKLMMKRGVFMDDKQWASWIERKLQDATAWELLKQNGYVELVRGLPAAAATAEQQQWAVATQQREEEVEDEDEDEEEGSGGGQCEGLQPMQAGGGSADGNGRDERQPVPQVVAGSLLGPGAGVQALMDVRPAAPLPSVDPRVQARKQDAKRKRRRRQDPAVWDAELKQQRVRYAMKTQGISEAEALAADDEKQARKRARLAQT